MWQMRRLLHLKCSGLDRHVIGPAVATFDVVYLSVLDEIERRAQRYLLQRELPRPQRSPASKAPSQMREKDTAALHGIARGNRRPNH